LDFGFWILDFIEGTVLFSGNQLIVEKHLWELELEQEENLSSPRLCGAKYFFNVDA